MTISRPAEDVLPSRDPAHWQQGMRFELEFDDDAYDVTVTASGRASLADVERHLADLLADPTWRPGMNALVDLTRVDSRHLTASDVREIADLYGEAGGRIGSGSCAIVVGSPASYGLARMWEAHARLRLALNTRVFYSADEARRWLREVTPARDDR